MSPGHSPSTCTPQVTTCGCSRRATPPSTAPPVGAEPVAGPAADARSAWGPQLRVLGAARRSCRSGAPAYLIDCPALYARATLYTTDPDEHLRFLALHARRAHRLPAPALGAADPALQRLAHRVRAAVPAHRCTRDEPLFAAHPHAAHDPQHRLPGHLPAPRSSPISGCRPARAYLLHQDDLRAGRINPLRHGILYADAITTVSPTHARRSAPTQYGMGLQDSLRARGAGAVGHPERRRLRRVGPAPRSLPAASTTTPSAST